MFFVLDGAAQVSPAPTPCVLNPARHERGPDVQEIYNTYFLK
jgi:hypothetical protein